MDIYNTEYYYEKSLKNIQNWNTSENNKQLIIQFLNKMQLNGISIVQLQKYLFSLKKFLEMYKDDLKKAQPKDIDTFLESMQDLKPKSRKIRYFCLKKFFDFIGRSDIFNGEKIKFEKSGHKLPQDLVTEEEVERMVDKCNNIRDKAFIAVLYESGCRIGEILTLKIKNVIFDNKGAVLLVNGKTGERRVRILRSALMLRLYIDNHPFKEDSESMLWMTKYNRRKKDERGECIKGFQPLNYRGAAEILKEAAKRAEIKKRVHPHLLRHSRATELARKGLNESLMKGFFGWQQSSEMANIYVHLAGRDIDSALLKLYGFEEDEEKKTEKLENVLIKFFDVIGKKFPEVKEDFKKIAQEEGWSV
jgi:site-specific recombinase XerD